MAFVQKPKPASPIAGLSCMVDMTSTNRWRSIANRVRSRALFRRWDCVDSARLAGSCGRPHRYRARTFVRAAGEAVPGTKLRAMPQRGYDDVGRPSRPTRRHSGGSAPSTLGSHTEEDRRRDHAAEGPAAADQRRAPADGRVDHARSGRGSLAPDAEERPRAAPYRLAVSQHPARVAAAGR